MATWLTTHYPKEGVDRNTPWHIYLKDKYQNKAKVIHENDLVFFYELKGEMNTGSGSIVMMARVDKGGLRKNIYGHCDIWPWQIPCRDLRRGKVDPDTLDELLGYSFTRSPRITGGIRPLPEMQANQLRSKFFPERES